MSNSNVYTELTWSILGNEKVPSVSVVLAGCPVLCPPILSLVHLSKYCRQGRPQKCISWIKNASFAVLKLYSSFTWFYKCRQILILVIEVVLPDQPYVDSSCQWHHTVECLHATSYWSRGSDHPMKSRYQ